MKVKAKAQMVGIPWIQKLADGEAYKSFQIPVNPAACDVHVLLLLLNEGLFPILISHLAVCGYSYLPSRESIILQIGERATSANIYCKVPLLFSMINAPENRSSQTPNLNGSRFLDPEERCNLIAKIQTPLRKAPQPFHRYADARTGK